jgi:hypothetical protein
MDNWYVLPRTPGHPPLRVKAEKVTCGKEYVCFYDDHGNEVARFNTLELTGYWLIDEAQIVQPQRMPPVAVRQN